MRTSKPSLPRGMSKRAAPGRTADDLCREGLVDVVGVDALTEAGISPDEFAAPDDLASLGVELPDDATAVLGDALGECDVVETLEGM